MQQKGKGRVRPAVRDESFVREVNERIAALRPSGMFVEFACECARRGCTAAVVLGMDEFDSVRRTPGRYVVAPGHQAPAGERVVDACDRYAVVERIVAVQAVPR